MQNEHQLLKEELCLLNSCLICRLTISRLDNLEVPTAKIIPEEFIGNHKCLRDTVAAEVILNLCECSVELLAEPSNCRSIITALGKTFINTPTIDKAVCVPNLITEITTLLAECIIKHKVITCA